MAQVNLKWGLTGADTNSYYDGLNSTAIEERLESRWSEVYQNEIIITKLLYGGGRGVNFNKGFQVKGTSVLFPVTIRGIQDGGAVAGTTAYTQLQYQAGNTSLASGKTPNLRAGFTQAVYEWTKYEGAFWVTEEERMLGMSNERGNLMEGQISQLLFDFKDQFRDDLYANATTAPAQSTVGTWQHFLGTANTVGQISQTTYAAWQSNVTTGAGAFSLDLVDTKLHKIRTNGRGPSGRIDALLLSSNDTVDTFGKMYQSIAPAEMIQNPGKVGKFGFEDFMYRNVSCFLDGSFTTTGTIIGLTTDRWYMAGTESPRKLEVQRLDGRSVMEHYYVWWVGIFTNDPGMSFRIEGIV